MALPEAIYEAAFEQAALPMVIADPQGLPVLWNRAFDALFPALSGKPLSALRVPLFEWFEDRGARHFSYYVPEIMMGARSSASVETSMADATGAPRWFRVRLSLVQRPGETARRPGDERREERYILCMLEEISEQKARERILLDAKEEAERTTSVKSQFLANMSHEIRTPIQTILGMAELLGSSALDPEQCEYLRQVRFSADILLQLINDILDFSKVEAGKMDLESLDFSLRSCVEQSIDLLVLDAHRKDLEVVVDIDESLPDTVRGDPGRLRQILVNLVKNAVKFTSEGSITLTVRRLAAAGRGAPARGRDQESADGQAPSWARFEVADTGPGVPETSRNELFSAFHQGAGSSARATGTGLGLAICRSLISLMGGSIEYLPREGGGSRFRFDIPLRRSAFGLPAPDRRLPEGRRVLVVDDHPAARALSRRLLASFGAECAEASSGAEALATLRKAAGTAEAFHACLIDRTLPVMDGWRLAGEITADPALRDLGLVLSAPEGSFGAEAKMKLLRWFDGYIAKPIKPAALFEAFKRAFEGSGIDKTSPRDPGEEAAELLPLEDASREAGGLEAKAFDLSVLIAEDHEINARLFTLLLEKLGCETVLVGDGQEAVEAAAVKRFDLILLDILMPRMDGYQASRAIREGGFHGPIIAVTASALKGEREKCVEAGMNDILTKPFKSADLERMLAFWAGKARSIEETRMAEEEEGSRQFWEKSVFDFAGVVETFLGRKDVVVPLLGKFIDKVKGQIADLENALGETDFQSVLEIAHSIKGSSWNLTAKRMGDAAMALETAGRKGDAEACREALASLKDEFYEFGEAAQYFVDLF